MAIDMKKIIAQETITLLFDKKVKKLTVKDIVDACHITRQAFYYHFADISELMKWMLEQMGNEFFLEYGNDDDMEEHIRRFLTVAVNAQPVLKKGLESNYGRELNELFMHSMQDLFRRLAQKQGMLQEFTPFEQEFMTRYHCQAIMGIIQSWTDEDTKNMDQIVHAMSLAMSKGIAK